MFQFSPLKKNIDSLVAALVGFLIIFLFTRHGGIGISPDSVIYTSGAENLQAHGSYIDFTNEAIIDFPVFYSILLAVISWLTQLKIFVFAPYLNALVFATVIFLTGNMIELFAFRNKWYKAALLACIILNPGLLEIYSMLWSETIFILFLVLFIMAMHRYINAGSRKALLAAAIVTALACITRYAGVCIIASGGLVILLNSKFPWRKRLIDGIIFGIIAASLFVINISRNYQVSETFTGYREQSVTSFTQNLHNTGIVFLNWIGITNYNDVVAVIIPAIIITALAVICLRNYFKEKAIGSFETLTAFLALIYLLFIIITATISRFEALNSRFISPAFIFLLLGITSWMPTFFSQFSGKAKQFAIATVVLIFLGFQFGQFDADAKTWDMVKDAGIPGYTEDGWTQSPTVLFVEKNLISFKKNYTIYSDATDAIYWFTHRPGKYLPGKRDDIEIQEFLDDRHCYVVWFNDGEDDDRIDKNFLTQVKKMKLIKQFEDGSIYEYDSPFAGQVKD